MGVGGDLPGRIAWIEDANRRLLGSMIPEGWMRGVFEGAGREGDTSVQEGRRGLVAAGMIAERRGELCRRARSVRAVREKHPHIPESSPRRMSACAGLGRRTLLEKGGLGQSTAYGRSESRLRGVRES